MIEFAREPLQIVQRVTDAVLRNRAAYKNCFSGLAGERVLRDLYKFCHMGQTTHVTDCSDETAFREGKRAVFLRIFHAMKIHDERKELQRLEEMRDE